MPYKNKVQIKVILIMLSLIFLLGLVGKMDAEDEDKAFKTYCADVTSGIYPDYKKQLNYCD